MEQKKVIEIIRLYKGQTPVRPTLSADDTISSAVQKMLENDVQRMVVVRRGKPIGVVHLTDALLALGLEVKDYPSVA
ncbi:MAG: CBS domain-containing protein [Deltaproteobacteria bacterium]|nr:CBS domain-containing protein [Deltaproteobacteria bacterium]